MDKPMGAEKKTRVLIVDDSRIDRRILKKSLVSAGYTVEEAKNGKHALEMALADPPDMIVSDALMPVMDGFQLCREIRKDRRTTQMPFVLYTGTYKRAEDRELAISIGADRFVLKTGNKTSLLKEIREVLAERENMPRAPFDPGPAESWETERRYNQRLIQKLEEKVKALKKEMARRKKAETAIEREATSRAGSDEKYRKILESIEEGYFEVDLAGNLLFFNKALTEILGYPPSELAGLNYKAYMDAENVAKTYETFHQVYETGEPLKGYEWQIIRPDGHGLYLDTSVSPIKDADGKVNGFRGVTRDVTQRRLLAKFLAETEERYRLLFENAPVGIFHYDREGVIRACNQAYVDINGSSFGKLIGFNLLQRVTNQAALAAVKKSLDGFPGHYEGEYVSVTGGRKSYINLNFVPVFSKGEILLGGMGVVEDISDRKSAEYALRDSEEKYRGLAERIPGIIILSDATGVCSYISPSVERILGYQQDEVIGKVPGDFMTAEDAQRLIQATSHCMNGESVQTVETEISKKNGELVLIEWEGTPVSEAGRITSVQFCGRDVTDRKRAEQALESSRLELKALSKHLQVSREQERAAIAREVHDELGQTLTALKMDGAWLLSKIPENRPELIQKTREAIALIDASIGTVKRIVSDLRPGLLDDLGLSAAIDWQVGEYRKRSEINFNLSIKPADIFLDAELSIAVFRVCQEALTNVMRHSGATDVQVRLMKSRGEVALIVTDNGRGINEKELVKTDSFGLIGMRERIHSFGGTIGIFKNKKGGTTVAVRVPVTG